MPVDTEVTLFAETNFRGLKRRFGIKRNDRRRHMYIIGKTGMGKTTLLENMTIQDIQNGEGVGIVDPHGEYAERMLDFVPKSRISDVVYFNPADLEYPLAFNVMEDVGADRRHLVSSGLLGVFKKIWGPEVWSGRMEYLLSNSILALLETPGTTLLGVNRILADKEYRKQIVANVKDPIVKAFWENEYARYTEKFATEAGAAVQNKIGQFTSNPLIRNIIGQTKSAIDMRNIMDEKKIFIMNLSKGRIGEENARLLGAMLITRLYLAAMTRIDLPEEKRNDFYLYVDEFQNFATESFASILSEARKYRLDLILAHQYVTQMDETVRDAVFGNIGTMLTFRVGATDAELLEKELSPEFIIQDIVNLGFANIYLRLMIDGVASRPFSATTLPPAKVQDISYQKEIIESSRKLYGRNQKEIEKEIFDWQGFNKEGASREGPLVRPAPASMPRSDNRSFERSTMRSFYEQPKNTGGFQREALRGDGRGNDRGSRQDMRDIREAGTAPLIRTYPDAERKENKDSSKNPYPEKTPLIQGGSTERRGDAMRIRPHPMYSSQEVQRERKEEIRERIQPPLVPERKQNYGKPAPAPEAIRQRQEVQQRYPVTDIRHTRNDQPTILHRHREQEPRIPPASPRMFTPASSRGEDARKEIKTQKPTSFIPLASLKPKEASVPQHDRKESDAVKAAPPVAKKAIDFSELKKALSESFGPSKNTSEENEERGILRDRTGMIKPAGADTTSASSANVPNEKKSQMNISRTNTKQSGILKPGERIRFD